MATAAVCVIIAIAALWHARTHRMPRQLKLAGIAGFFLAVALLPFVGASDPVDRLFEALVGLGLISLLAGYVMDHRQDTADYREAKLDSRPALAPRWPTGLVWLTWFLICAVICYAVMAGVGTYTDATITPLVESSAPVEELQRTIGDLAAVYLLVLIACTVIPFIVPTIIAWRYDRRTKAQARTFLNKLERAGNPSKALR